MIVKPGVIFVCEHGAAKSIIAATFFNELAKERGLHVQAIARGTNPDDKLSEQAVYGLARDGLMPTEPIPRSLSIDDVQSAEQIIAFCELPAAYSEATIIEQWNDVPPVSQDYDKARDVILVHLHELINRIRSSP